MPRLSPSLEARLRLGLILGVSLAVLSVLSGCSPQVLPNPEIVRGVPPDGPAVQATQAAALAAQNENAGKYYKDMEWHLNRRPGRAPEIGIALSGGGMRSATFSLGVLSGLHRAKVFPQNTDLLSAVSGGGYIATWFYAQQILYGTSPDVLLDPKGPAQGYLEDHGDFVEIKPRHPASIPVVVGTVGPMAAVNVVANLAFGWHANTPLTSPYYMYRFQKTFFTSPRNRTGTPTISWQQVRDTITTANQSGDPERHLPNFILNTTAALGYLPSRDGKAGFNAVYEFTPQRFGSEGMGFYCYWDPADPEALFPDPCKDWRPPLAPLERIAVTSGAAFDSSVISGRGLRMAASALNLDLGHFFPNPAADPGFDWGLLLPFPLYTFTNQYRLDVRGRRMLLTDGGHSENLGVYALVRRLPSKIVVVDGSGDKDHKLKDYRNLKEMLLLDLGLVLSIPDLDRKQPRPGPIYYGKIGAIPVGDGTVWKEIDVVYIKIPKRSDLEVECDRVGGPPLPSFCPYLKTHTSFPFHSTFGDQSYDPTQFAAYRDLGLWVVENAATPVAQSLGLP